MIVFFGGGIFIICYLVFNDNGCVGMFYQDEVILNIFIGLNFDIIISGVIFLLCIFNIIFFINVGCNSFGFNLVVIIDNGIMVMIGNFGSNIFVVFVGVGFIIYEICLEELNVICDVMDCEIFMVFNDGLDCGVNVLFSFQCLFDEGFYDFCVINIQLGLLIGCLLIFFEMFFLFGVEVDFVNGVIQCLDEFVEVDWQGSLGGVIGDVVIGGLILGSINDVVEVVCDVIIYEFCVDVGFVEFCFDLFLFGFFEDVCD